jgi:L-threonine-O-3-phosphate decarboxylase
VRRVAPPADVERLFRHGGARPDEAGLLDFSAGINPLGPPASVVAAVRERAADIDRYPDPNCRQLIDLIVERHQLDGATILFGNGTNELIHAIARAFPRQRAAVIEPAYTEYLRACRLAHTAVQHWLPDGPDFTPTAPGAPVDADQVWLANPVNPTGRLWPAESRWVWLRSATAVTVVDEAYLPLRPDGEARSLTYGASWRQRWVAPLLVLRSLTKLYALPGLRLGYVVGPPDALARVREQLPPWSVNTLAQTAGVAALRDDDYLRRTHAWFAAEQPALGQALAEFAAFDVIPSEANFYLLRLRSPEPSSTVLTARLRERGIAIRDASNFVGLNDRYVRVAVRTSADNGRLLDALRSVLRRG